MKAQETMVNKCKVLLVSRKVGTCNGRWQGRQVRGKGGDRSAVLEGYSSRHVEGR